ncbi:hypothetical protein [Alkalitalea saponilacus]|uniref:NVEALA protein n=1 Tax=Alkalitalea saponilacus TaxID=889453 RepID=A0A1T5GEM9_9BACT|nr:hypothetical protein [Alkalitalea saponilacus]ASB47948.1 hypothetical protein CDL62_01665 [Alkalitalea saponilacus]SKC06875.1 hypothetical protein SAMN03080601_01836 [Alkalitalea saponilacus]
MKKKLFFAIATGFFAVATMFNMNILQGNSAGDISLDAIAVMAQAQDENVGDENCSYRAKVHDSGTRSGTYQLYDGHNFWNCHFSYNYTSTDCIGQGGTLCCTPSITCTGGYDSCGGNPCP